MKPYHASSFPHLLRSLRPWWAVLLVEAALLALLAACGGGGGDAGAGAGTDGEGVDGGSPPPSGAAPAADLPAPRRSARLFISGHSLVDNPLPDDLVRIANSLGGNSEYNEQNIIGSPLRLRTRGANPAASDWSGYRQGKNREGQNMDVLAELARPRTVGGLYDVLILTERNDLVGTLLWEDTVRYARQFHDRAAAARPGVNTYFYESWLGLQDKGAPAEWIAYERAASRAWGCIDARINQSLSAEGRSERIVPLRAGRALAQLVERATQGTVDGISGASVRETVDRVVQDDVHPTRLGMYYMALVSYATVYRQSPVGAWRPAEVSAAQAASLQRLAWEFVQQQEREPAPSLAPCAAWMRDSFCTVYGTYRRDPSQGTACQARFAAPGHPFEFNPQTERAYWLPAP